MHQLHRIVSSSTVSTTLFGTSYNVSGVFPNRQNKHLLTVDFFKGGKFSILCIFRVKIFIRFETNLEQMLTIFAPKSSGTLSIDLVKCYRLIL